jgi:hypothetical protein
MAGAPLAVMLDPDVFVRLVFEQCHRGSNLLLISFLGLYIEHCPHMMTAVIDMRNGPLYL